MNFQRIYPVLFSFLLACILILPVQSQTAVPTLAPVPSCGLPTTSTDWTSSTSQTVWNMTADCVVPLWPNGNPFIRVRSGDFTINGNGYSIIGARNNFAVSVVKNTSAAAILRLNNVKIVGSGPSIGVPVRVKSGGILHATNVTIRDHQLTNVNPTGISAMWVDNTGTEAHLTNVAFINNSFGPSESPAVVGSALTVFGAAQVVLNNVLFRNNGGRPQVVRVNKSTLRLRDCIRFENNYRTDGSRARNITLRSDGTLDDQSDSSLCPRRRVAPPPKPTPTETPQPSYEATHVALQTNTGMVFRPTYGLDSGAYFRQLDGAGIGVQSLADNFIEAVDVYGYVEQGVEICFPQVGRVIFLDASTSPRTMVQLEATVVDSTTCVSISSPGSLVLLPPE